MGFLNLMLKQFVELECGSLSRPLIKIFANLNPQVRYWTSVAQSHKEQKKGLTQR